MARLSTIGVDAILVTPSDPGALAAGIRRVLHDPELAQQLTETGRERSERYRWSTVTEEIERAYRDAIAARARQPA